MAAAALERVGVEQLTVDLSSPTLVTALVTGLGCSAAETAALRAALARKDAAEVARAGGAAGKIAKALLEAAGPAGPALEALSRLALPPASAAEAERLAEVATLVRNSRPELALTVDPVEYRGFEYQTGVSFTLFARGVRGELGRGGRYLAGGNGAPSEPATGFTLFLDSVSRAAPLSAPRPRLFLPCGTPEAAARRLRAEWIAIMGLEPAADARAEARRMGCSHLYAGGRIEALG